MVLPAAQVWVEVSLKREEIKDTSPLIQSRKKKKNKREMENTLLM